MNLRGLGFSLRGLCSPGFNCHGCPWATAACPVGVMTFSSAIRTFPALAIGTVLTIGAACGRLACGFACPFGLLQDMLGLLRKKKIKLPGFTRWSRYACLVLLVLLFPWLLGIETKGFLKVEKPLVDKAASGNLVIRMSASNPGDTEVLSPEFEAVLVSKEGNREILKKEFVFAGNTVPSGGRFSAPPFEMENRLSEADLFVRSKQSGISQEPRYKLYFCKLCPKGTLTASVPAMLSGSGEEGIYGGRLKKNALRLGILAVFLVLMVLVRRPFCRLACPLGAIYGLLAPLALLRIRVDPGRCTRCKACVPACPVDLDPPKEVGGMDCIACGDCMKACPQSAIRRGFLS